MDIKEFKKRWIRGYINKNLFALPIKNENEFDPMILEIIVDDLTVDVGFRCNQTRSSNISLYEATINGIALTKDNFPNLFNDGITNGAYTIQSENRIRTMIFDSVSTGLCSNHKSSLIVDWGDGTTDNYTDDINVAVPWIMTNNPYYDEFRYCIKDSQTQELYYIDGYIPMSKYITHKYAQTGRYTVKLYGSLHGLRFENNNSSGGNIKISKILNWGNLNLINACYLFYVQQYFEYISANISGLDKAIEATGMFSYSNVNWDLLNPNIIDFMPNLFNADSMFNRSDANYIPAHFMDGHLNVNNISNIFHCCPIEYVGDYAFANMTNLVIADSVFAPVSYFHNGNWRGITGTNPTTHIGNSIFENDINMTNCPYFGYCNQSISQAGVANFKSIGKNIFKNCKSLTDIGTYTYQMNFDLESVGESMFEGCESLQNAQGLFYNCLSLTTVGKDMFKGCKNLRTVSFMFYNCPQVNIPENFLYDLEYNSDLSAANNRVNLEYFCYTYYSYRDYYNNGVLVKELSGNVDFGGVNSPYYTKFLAYHFDNVPTVSLGKNLFNPAFLNALIANGSYINGGRYTLYGHVDFHYKYNDSTKTYEENKYKVPYTGTVPEFWNYNSDKLFNNQVYDFTNYYGYVRQYGTTTSLGCWKEDENGNSYYDETYINQNYYDIQPGMWSNYSSIPKPTVLIKDNVPYSQNSRWLGLYARYNSNLYQDVVIVSE